MSFASSGSMPFSRSDAFALAFLSLITLAVFGHACRNDFVKFDDHEYVGDNEIVQGGLTRQGVYYAFTTNDAANWHPLTWLSLELDAQIFSLQPWGFHLTNVLLHLANTLLLFWVLRRMTGFIWRSALVAALFAVHPLHVESVAWVSERKDVLSTLFWMLTLLAYVRYVERPGWWRYTLVAVALALGLLAKPMLVTLPCVLLLLDYWPLRRFSFQASLPATEKTHALARAATPLGTLVLEKIPLLLLSFAASFMTWRAQTRTIMSWDEFSLSTRLSNALNSYALYLAKMLWPVKLAAYYPHPRGGLPVWQVVIAALCLLVVSLIAIWMLRRLPYLAVGWFWYVGTLVPVIGLVQVGRQGMADRYTYVPLIGIFILAVWGLADLVARLRIQKFALAVTGMYLLVLMVHASTQVLAWRDTESLWKHTLAVTERNALAEGGLGMIEDDRGNYVQALQHYRASLAIDPFDAKIHTQVGQLLLAQSQTPPVASARRNDGAGNTDKVAEALSHFQEAVRLDPQNSLAEYNIGLIHATHGEVDQAVEHFKASLKYSPDNPFGHYNLGLILLEAHKPKEAIDHIHRALELYGSESARQDDLATALTARGNSQEAAAHKKKARDIRVEMAEMHSHLAAASLALSEKENARQEYVASLELNPVHEGAMEGLAELYLSTGQAQEILRIYGSSLEKLVDKARACRNLGRASAQREKWDDAANWYRRGISQRQVPPDMLSSLHGGLGLALQKLGQREEARQQYQEAVRVNPRWTQMTRDQAWFWATNPQAGLRNGPLALDLAQQLCQADAQSLDTLAAAYAEVQRFGEAAATARQALAAASSQADKKLAEKIRQRLQLYESKQPFRE